MISTEVTYLPTTTFYIVAHGDPAVPKEERPLPSHILLQGGGVMVRRQRPVCIDMPRQGTNHAMMYAKLLMNLPWSNEADYLGNAALSEESCLLMWEAEHHNCKSSSEDLKRMLQLSLLG